MSKFNHYAKEAEEAVKQAVAQYHIAKSDSATAKKAMDEVPMCANPHDPIYQAKAILAKDEWERKHAQFNAIQIRLVDDIKSRMNAIRRDLEADLEESFAASPDQVDASSLELLKSGILTPGEYVHMIDEAAAKENFTMTRLIGRYASDALDAEVKKNGNSSAASKLRLAVVRSRENSAEGYLDAFDAIAYTARRCIENPGMQAHWDQAAGELVKNF